MDAATLEMCIVWILVVLIFLTALTGIIFSLMMLAEYKEDKRLEAMKPHVVDTETIIKKETNDEDTKRM